MRQITVILALFTALCAGAQVNIWEGTGVHRKVKLTPFLAPGSRNMAVVVCPGGSYFWHDMRTEGTGVARWLQANGISAFVLDYRTAQVPAYAWHTRLIVRGNQYPDPQNDLQQAIRYLRDHAREYGICPDSIGAMGFSAGGHLVMSVAEWGAPDARPAFVAAVYPVVSMSDRSTHRRSRRGLLGEYRKFRKKWKDSLSLEKHVPADCPPVFLVNCQDDPVVKYRNSVLLDSALTARNIPHVYRQYRTGGHGFGASEDKGTAESRQWKEEFLNWIKTVSHDRKEPEIR